MTQSVLRFDQPKADLVPHRLRGAAQAPGRLIDGKILVGVPGRGRGFSLLTFQGHLLARNPSLLLRFLAHFFSASCHGVLSPRAFYSSSSEMSRFGRPGILDLGCCSSSGAALAAPSLIQARTLVISA